MPSERWCNKINIANQIGVGTEKDNLKINNFRIKWLRITFESDPYLIAYGDVNGVSQYHPANDNDTILTESKTPFPYMSKDDYYIGHVLRVFYGSMNSSSANDVIVKLVNRMEFQ